MITITHDKSAHNALYIKLNNNKITHQATMPDGEVYDLDGDGQIVGIEIIGFEGIKELSK